MPKRFRILTHLPIGVTQMSRRKGPIEAILAADAIQQLVGPTAKVKVVVSTRAMDAREAATDAAAQKLFADVVATSPEAKVPDCCHAATCTITPLPTYDCGEWQTPGIQVQPALPTVGDELLGWLASAWDWAGRQWKCLVRLLLSPREEHA